MAQSKDPNARHAKMSPLGKGPARGLGQASRRAAWAALLAATALATPALAQTFGRVFDIPGEPLAQALKDYGRAADQQLLFAPELVRGLRSHPVQGRLGPDAALDLLLQDTGLGWRRAPAGGILIEGRADARPPEARAAGAPPEPATALEELVVTGTHIAGAAPVGARPVILDQGEILRIGRSNAADLLRAIPQNASLGVGEEARGAPQSSQPNLNFGNSPNLRGLGTDATLTLIDGVRAPPTTYGGLVDVSQIPLIAVQRVEVLADGASAIYGSDAVGGVVNFVLRHDVEGGEARVRAGVADGLDDETADLAQGRVWSTGSVFAALEYEHRSSLATADRSYFTDDLRAFGGPDLRRPNASPANLSALGITYALPGGPRGSAPGPLVAGTRNLDNRWEQADILPSISRLSGAITFRQELSPWASLFFEGLGQSRESVKRDAPLATTLVVPSSNPFFISPVPGASTVNVLYSSIGDFGPIAPKARTEDVLLTGGLKLKLPKAWSGTLEGTFAHDRTLFFYDSLPNLALTAQALANPDPSKAFDPFGGRGDNPAAIVDPLRGYVSDRSHVSYAALDAGASGPLLRLPGGELRAAIGMETRHEHLVSSNATFISRLTPSHSGFNLARDVNAAYAEVNLPLVGADTARPGIAVLTASASVRTEDYSDTGRTTNPRYGLEWSPVADLKISASWGTSFKAPTLYQKDTSTNSILVTQYPVASAPGGFVNVIQLAGKATGLKPETAETWTLGAGWRPARWPGLELGVNYFSVRYRDRIEFGSTVEIAAALASGAPSPLVLIRSPTAAQVAAYYADPIFSAGSTRPAPDQIAAVVDFRQNNLGSVEQTGFDYSAAYHWETSLGRLEASADVVQVTRYAVAQVSGQPLASLLNTNANPIAWRGFAALGWTRGGWDAVLRVNYVGAYRNTMVLPVQKVSPWTTFDLHLAYAPTGGLLGRSGVKLAVDVQNLFDRDPPRVVNVLGAIGYDPEEATAMGRFASLTLSKAW